MKLDDIAPAISETRGLNSCVCYWVHGMRVFVSRLESFSGTWLLWRIQESRALDRSFTSALRRRRFGQDAMAVKQLVQHGKRTRQQRPRLELACLFWKMRSAWSEVMTAILPFPAYSIDTDQWLGSANKGRRKESRGRRPAIKRRGGWCGWNITKTKPILPAEPCFHLG